MVKKDFQKYSRQQTTKVLPWETYWHNLERRLEKGG